MQRMIELLDPGRRTGYVLADALVPLMLLGCPGDDEEWPMLPDLGIFEQKIFILFYIHFFLGRSLEAAFGQGSGWASRKVAWQL